MYYSISQEKKTKPNDYHYIFFYSNFNLICKPISINESHINVQRNFSVVLIFSLEENA